MSQPPPTASASSPPVPPWRPPFVLWALLIYLLGAGIVVGGLAVLGVSPLWSAIGFVAIPLFCGAIIGFIELVNTLRRKKLPEADLVAELGNAPPRVETGNPFQSPQ